MVTGEGGLRRRDSLIDGLLVPRPITQLLMLVMGVSLSEIAWIYLSLDFVVYLSGVAAPFCMVCAAAIWSMREKVDSALDPDYLDATEFRESRTAHRQIRHRAMFQAGVAAMCALAALSPAISKQLVGPVWHWMVLLAGAGVARASYGYLLASAWEDQMIDLREKLIQRAKDSAAKKSLEEAIRSSSVTRGAFPGWTEVAGEVVPPNHH